jgi:hypothetical protein
MVRHRIGKFDLEAPATDLLDCRASCLLGYGETHESCILALVASNWLAVDDDLEFKVSLTSSS